MTVADQDKAQPGYAAIAVRTAVATLGAYGLCYVLAPVLTALLARASVGRADAVMIGTVVCLFVFPAVSIWAFAERRLAVVVCAPAAAIAVLALAWAALRP